MSTPRPLGFCIRHGYGNSLHEKQDDCVNWWAEGAAAPLEPSTIDLLDGTANKLSARILELEKEIAALRKAVG